MALTLVCGVSFSGKSTLAALIAAALSAEVVSLDEINEERGLLGGHGIPAEEWAETNRIARVRAGQLLRDGREVVVDDTGSLRVLRDEWRRVARAAGRPFALVWVRADDALRRRRLLDNRTALTRHDVTDATMAQHVATFEEPTDDEVALMVDGAESRSASRVAQITEFIRAMG